MSHRRRSRKERARDPGRESVLLEAEPGSEGGRCESVLLCFHLGLRNRGDRHRTAFLMNSSKKVDLKIIILGSMGVGKTSLLQQYVNKRFYEDYRTTLGASVLTKSIKIDDASIKLQIWDTGGQERFRSMVSTFYKGSDGCILAFDVTDQESFDSVEDWRQDFLQRIRPSREDFPMVMLGNKIDIGDRQVKRYRRKAPPAGATKEPSLILKSVPRMILTWMKPLKLWRGKP
uniref:Ras-related protein Rab-7b n=1 Tax=Geotrypetes seraphini TaxID=260995 RepID=A0A6P8PHE7_GEOSA|nr:ras-related protein Rab-7b isoform X2 [Geotrypetes seraphini]